jgi:hypothetical protein
MAFPLWNEIAHPPRRRRELESWNQQMPPRSVAGDYSAAPASYQTETNHNDDPKLPPLLDCLMSTILICGCSPSQVLIYSSKARAFLSPFPTGPFFQKSLTFIREPPFAAELVLVFELLLP